MARAPRISMTALDRLASEIEVSARQGNAPMLGRFPPGYAGHKFKQEMNYRAQTMMRFFAAAFLDPIVLMDGLRSLQARVREGDLETWRFIMSYLVGQPVRRDTISVNGPEALQAWLEQLQVTGAVKLDEDEEGEGKDESEYESDGDTAESDAEE